MNNLGIKQRRVSNVTILETDSVFRVALKFGGSGVPLEKAVESLLSSGQKHILLNLRGVKSINAKGLGELVSIYVTVTKGGGQFKLFNLTPMVRQLMSATNLSSVFDFYESEERAIESFISDVTLTHEMPPRSCGAEP